MSGRSKSPIRGRQVIHQNRHHDKYDDLINDVLKGVERFSREVHAGVTATFENDSLTNSDYLEFRIEGTIKNDEVFKRYLATEAGVENHVYFSLCPSVQAGTQVILFVAKRFERAVEKAGLLRGNYVNQLLLVFLAICLYLAGRLHFQSEESSAG